MFFNRKPEFLHEIIHLAKEKRLGIKLSYLGKVIYEIDRPLRELRRELDFYEHQPEASNERDRILLADRVDKLRQYVKHLGDARQALEAVLDIRLENAEAFKICQESGIPERLLREQFPEQFLGA